MKTAFKYLKNDNDLWILAEDIPNIDLFFCQIWLRSFVNTLKRTMGLNYKKVISLHRGFHQKYYFGRKDSFHVAEHLLDLIEKDLSFGDRINENIIKHADRLRAFLEKLQDKHLLHLSDLSNKELWDIFGEHNRVHTEAYAWFWLPQASDNFHNNFTSRLMKYLKTKIKDQQKLNECFVKLTNTGKKSVLNIELEEFLSIAAIIDAEPFHRELFKTKNIKTIKQRVKPAIKRIILKHYYKYHHLKYNFLGTEGVYDFEYYLKNLSDIFKSGIDIKKRLAEEKERPIKEMKEKERLLAKFDIDEHHKRLFKIFGEFMITKVYRRNVQIKALYLMDRLLRETARRLDISDKQVRFLLITELEDALRKGRIARHELAERAEFCIYYAEKGIENIFIGKKAKELAQQFKEKKEMKVTELRGTCASTGKAKGIVKIINNPVDIKKMKKGDILVSIATNPDLVPAMEKAAAILTDYGGVTAHAAIVSRELGVPCIIGLRIATKVLKDGDLVEVDATKGIVRKAA